MRNIIDSLASPDLAVTELIDPDQIDFFANSLADQMNGFWTTFSKKNSVPVKQVVDLSKYIADIIIETTAQGSSLLEVHVIDPVWTLLWPDPNGNSFINTDESGFLWPPIEVNFPKDVSDAVWRLCQVRASTDLNAANVILTFEDKIASELREHWKPQSSFPNQTRAEFIQSLVKDANQNPIDPAEVDIRFVALLPKEVFTVADLTMSQRLPASATAPFAGAARTNPNKKPKKPSSRNAPSANSFNPVQWATLSIELGLGEVTGTTSPFTPFTPIPVGPHSSPP